MPNSRNTWKTFTATLERGGDRLNWTVIRVPLDVPKIWGVRGQLRVKGEINCFGSEGNVQHGAGHRAQKSDNAQGVAAGARGIETRQEVLRVAEPFLQELHFRLGRRGAVRRDEGAAGGADGGTINAGDGSRAGIATYAARRLRSEPQSARGMGAYAAGAPARPPAGNFWVPQS